MSRDFATGFYHSMPWRRVRDAYMKEGGGLCEPCMRRGRLTMAEIVHHKVHLTPENIDDPRIALDKSNLERVCRECHAMYHSGVSGRVGFDEEGNVVRLDG